MLDYFLNVWNYKVFKDCTKDERKMGKQEKKNWNIPVSKTLDDALELAVTADSHSSKSEFVRDAVRRRLEQMGFNPQVFDKKSI